MDSLRIVDGRVVSYHFICVRDSGALSDAALLEALGLVGYMPDTQALFPCRFAHILRAGDWTAYADDWYYTAYNSAGIGDAVARLSRDYEVLRIAIGDADESFEFHHFYGGSLHKGFHFHDHAGKTSVKLDRGPRLKCESAFQLGSDPSPFMWAVMDEIGIDMSAMTGSVSTYSKPYENR